MKKYLFLIPVLIAGIDQWIKSWIRTRPEGVAFFRMSGCFELVPSVNTGAAFSILSGNNLLLILFSVLLLFLCLYIRKTFRLTILARVAFLVLLGGGIGNLIDRVCFGGVTDYIRLLFLEFPIFNLADIAITCSVFVLILLLITNRLEESAGDTHE